MIHQRPLPHRDLVAFKIALLLTVISLITLSRALADVKLPALFSDGMVLQQGQPVPVWGWAENGEQVSVEFAGQKETTVARDGKWNVKLKPLKASHESRQLVVSGKNRVAVENVLVGEVWIASGQSNMEWPMDRSFESDEDIASANSTRLRLFTVPKLKQDEPIEDVKGSWSNSNPQSVKGFSAVAYYFGRDLQKALGVPVGVIHTSWGGSPAEVWMSKQVLSANPDYQRDILDAHQEQYKDYQNSLAAWEKEKADAEKAGQEFKKGQPRAPWKPTELYNGMIAPLIPYAFKGAIWYQGESNAGRAHQYRSLFPDMIKNWRKDWGQGDFTFLFVQLAPYDKSRRRPLSEITAQPVESDWAELREAQSYTLEVLPKTGMAVITDLGDKDDIHPTKKEPVGQRLALLAESIAYGKQDVISSGPMFKDVKFSEGKAVISFSNVGKGLASGKGAEVISINTFVEDKPVSPYVPDGALTSSFGGGMELVFGDNRPLTGFAIAGADRKFHWGTAKIVGRTVVVSSPKVPEPVAVRYGWSDYPVVNLYNSAGLPASPFRTDDWPGVTWPKN